MATDSTAICNLSLARMGQELIDDIDGTDILEEKCKLLYSQCLEEVTTMGPELGWKFARRRKRLDREEMSITAIALLTATTVTVTTAHTLVEGDLVVIDDTTSYDGEYEVLSVTGTTSFTITATFVATETGTAYWTSSEYSYRYTMPTSLRIVSVQSGGVEVTDWVREGVFLLTNYSDTDLDIIYVQSITTTTLFPPHFTRVLVLYLAIALHYNITQDLKAIQLLAQEYDYAMSKAIAMDEREKYVKEFSSSWVDIGNKTDTIE